MVTEGVFGPIHKVTGPDGFRQMWRSHQECADAAVDHARDGTVVSHHDVVVQGMFGPPERERCMTVSQIFSRNYGMGTDPRLDPDECYETEFEARARLQRENPLYTRHTEMQIRAMVHSPNPGWHDAALRREAQARGMKSAPWFETKLSDVLDFLREMFPEKIAR